MSLAPGSRLGPYDVLGLLGAGGMGEVYRARDTQLKRDVALKVLPADVAGDPDRLARLQREAELLAALNHPRIAQIHGLVDVAGTRALVMELVEGPTLAERLERGKVPVNEALPLAAQLAGALEYAHEHGIIHRDLKPANVKLKPDGEVKVLDFGLAKALEGSPTAELLSDSPTMTSPAMSRAGIILGTAAYMSPEQARGTAVDKRSDIWAFGVVLFEMLAGRRCFQGETVTDVLAAVVRAEPEWTALPDQTPPRVCELLRRCLTKDRRQRLHDIGDARLEIEAALGASSAGGTGTGAAPAAAWRVGGVSAREKVAWVSAAMALLLCVGAVTQRLTRAPGPETGAPVRPLRFTVTLPPGVRLRISNTSAIAVSPGGTHLVLAGAQEGRATMDGTHLVLAAAEGDRTQLYSRALDELDLQPIPGTVGATMPFFSPDGTWVGFVAGNVLRKVPLAGGTPTTVCYGGDVRGASWGADGWIVFTRAMRSGLWRVPADGGEPEEVTTLDRAKQEKTHRFPHVLPDGRGVLFASGTGALESYDDMTIVARRPGTGEQIFAVTGGMAPQYVESGHLVFARAGAIFAVPFDVARLVVTGPAVKVISGVRTVASGGIAEFSVSAGGTLAYVAGGATGEDARVIQVDRTGRERPLIETPGPYLHVRLSPDGRALATEMTKANEEIWVFDLDRGSGTRFASGWDNLQPMWTRDGRRLVFTSNRFGPELLFTGPVDGSAPVQQITSGDDYQYPLDLSPDGRTLVYLKIPGPGRELWRLSLEGDANPQKVIEAPGNQWDARLSPDGRWLAYESDQSGRTEIYVCPFPGPGGKTLVSAGGGYSPRWTRGGREIVYSAEDWTIMSVAMTLTTPLRASKPRPLLQRPRRSYVGYDVSTDGERFVFIVPGPSTAPPREVTIVTRWLDELKRLVPSGR